MKEKYQDVLLYTLIVIAICLGCFLVSQTAAYKHTLGSDTKIGFASEPIDYKPLIKWLEEQRNSKLEWAARYAPRKSARWQRKAKCAKNDAAHFQRSIDSLKMGIRPHKVTPYDFDPLWIRWKY